MPPRMRPAARAGLRHKKPRVPLPFRLWLLPPQHAKFTGATGRWYPGKLPDKLLGKTQTNIGGRLSVWGLVSGGGALAEGAPGKAPAPPRRHLLQRWPPSATPPAASAPAPAVKSAEELQAAEGELQRRDSQAVDLAGALREATIRLAVWEAQVGGAGVPPLPPSSRTRAAQLKRCVMPVELR